MNQDESRSWPFLVPKENHLQSCCNGPPFGIQAAWVKNPVTFESLAAIDQKSSQKAADLDQMQITVFDIHLKQGQMIKVNQGDLIKFVVPEETTGDNYMMVS